MKKTLALLLLLVLLLASCSAKEVHYSRPDTLAPVVTRMKDRLENTRLARLLPEEIAFSLGIEETEYEEGEVLVATGGASIDEVGFFLAKEGEADRLQKMLNDYLAESKEGKREWLRSYNPEEAEKLEQGEVFRYGDCLFYAFLSKEDMDDLKRCASDYLAEKHENSAPNA